MSGPISVKSNGHRVELSTYHASCAPYVGGGPVTSPQEHLQAPILPSLDVLGELQIGPTGVAQVGNLHLQIRVRHGLERRVGLVPRLQPDPAPLARLLLLRARVQAIALAPRRRRGSGRHEGGNDGGGRRGRRRRRHR